MPFGRVTCTTPSVGRTLVSSRIDSGPRQQLTMTFAQGRQFASRKSSASTTERGTRWSQMEPKTSLADLRGLLQQAGRVYESSELGLVRRLVLFSPTPADFVSVYRQLQRRSKVRCFSNLFRSKPRPADLPFFCSVSVRLGEQLLRSRLRALESLLTSPFRIGRHAVVQRFMATDWWENMALLTANQAEDQGVSCWSPQLAWSQASSAAVHFPSTWFVLR